MSTEACCAHLRVEYRTEREPNSSITRGWWQCVLCHTKFWPLMPEAYRARVGNVISQGLAILGKPRGVKNGAEADDWLRQLAGRPWCDDPPRIDTALRQAFADLDWMAMLESPYPRDDPNAGVQSVEERQLWGWGYHCRQRGEIERFHGALRIGSACV